MQQLNIDYLRDYQVVLKKVKLSPKKLPLTFSRLKFPLTSVSNYVKLPLERMTIVKKEFK